MNKLFQKDTITIYSYFKDDLTGGTGLTTYKKTVLHNSFWNENTNLINTQTGKTSTKAVTLTLFLTNDEVGKAPPAHASPIWQNNYGITLTPKNQFESVYVGFMDFKNLNMLEREDYFTLCVKDTTNNSSYTTSIITRFECPFDFGWADERDTTATGFLKKYIEPFRKEYANKFYNVKTIDEHIAGTPRMWNIEVGL